MSCGSEVVRQVLDFLHLRCKEISLNAREGRLRFVNNSRGFHKAPIVLELKRPVPSAMFAPMLRQTSRFAGRLIRAKVSNDEHFQISSAVLLPVVNTQILKLSCHF